jgi:hypothetical protein
MQSDDPGALPRLPERASSRLLEDPDEARDRQVAQIAGAVSALARKVDMLDRPPVTTADRREALGVALEYFTGLGLGRPPTVDEMVKISRYLTGE